MSTHAFSRMVAPISRRVRSMVGRCVLNAVDANTLRQVLKVKLLDGEMADGVEHFEPYGFTSHPLDGDGVFLAVGGNRSHGVVLNMGGKTYRLAGLKAGEVALYTDEGDQIVFKRGKTINIKSGAKVHIDAPQIIGDCQTAQINATTRATVNSPETLVTGTLTVQGQIIGQGGMAISGGTGATVDGDLTVSSGDVTADGISLKTHTHPGDSSGTTGQPT